MAKEYNSDIISLGDSFKNWYIDYSSEVLLNRAIPYIEDGCKPVQRRLLYTLYKMDDGRMIKASSVIGSTMLIHEHGDAGIESALITLAQKNLLLDLQGNFGNILTGDPASASRYLECRLNPLAKEILYSPKVTEWKPTYDGRSQEPVALPTKFPILLAMGSDGIAVSLTCKMLPHNFNEICDACIATYRGEEFKLFPDFQTGGILATENYNDGLKGGVLKCRAKIDIVDPKTLIIREIPYGTTTDSIRESIVKAIDKGKMKLKKVEDNTSDHVEIVLHLDPKSGISAKDTVDALYLFTDCEVSISPNAAVIKDGKPAFIGVSEILKWSAENIKGILKKELEVKLRELMLKLRTQLLEKAFILNRMYETLKTAETIEVAKATLKILVATKCKLPDVTDEEIDHLIGLPFKKLAKFDITQSDEAIKKTEEEINSTSKDIKDITKYAIKWFEHLKTKYGKSLQRKTTLVEKFGSTKDVASVAVNNVKLYVDKENGFFGFGDAMRKSGTYACDCSDIDDILVMAQDGSYTIMKVADKAFFKPGIVGCWPYKKATMKKDVYDIAYTDTLTGTSYLKRCTLPSLTRNAQYSVGPEGTEPSVIYVAREADQKNPGMLEVTVAPTRGKQRAEDVDLRLHLVKGRGAKGNQLFKGKKIVKIEKKETKQEIGL